MIKNGSKIILETIDGSYCPCTLVHNSGDNIVVRYMKRDYEKNVSAWRNDTVSKKNIVRMVEILS